MLESYSDALPWATRPFENVARFQETPLTASVRALRFRAFLTSLGLPSHSLISLLYPQPLTYAELPCHSFFGQR